MQGLGPDEYRWLLPPVSTMTTQRTTTATTRAKNHSDHSLARSVFYTAAHFSAQTTNLESSTAGSEAGCVLLHFVHIGAQTLLNGVSCLFRRCAFHVQGVRTVATKGPAEQTNKQTSNNATTTVQFGWNTRCQWATTTAVQIPLPPRCGWICCWPKNKTAASKAIADNFVE